MTKLLLPMDEDRIEMHEIIMTDVADLIEEYWEYLTQRFDGTQPKVIERLVFSYSDALWAAVLSKGIRVQRLTLAERWIDFKAWCKAQWDYFGKDWAERGESCEPW